MPNFENMIGNILETAKSVFDLEVISHSLVVIGAIFGAIGFIGKLLWKYQKRRNQKKYLQQLILKWHEELLNIQKIKQTPSGWSRYTTKYGTTVHQANTARVKITKDFFEDLKFAEQGKISCLSDHEKEEFRQALYDILRSNELLQRWMPEIHEIPLETYLEIFRTFQMSLPWLKL